MLQINTGKLFSRGVGRRNLLRGVLYSNARFPSDNDVVTAAGTLRCTDPGRGGRAVVYELEELIEAGPDGPGVLVSHTVSPFLEDFSVVASFYLNVLMSPDAEVVHRLAGGKAGFSSYRPPTDFVRRFFDTSVWITDNEASELASFVDRLLALERRSFLGAMRAMRTFVAGMHRLPDDLGLAYTLLVSAVESLAQDYDQYESSWSDVDERKRKLVDHALRKVANTTAEGVRAAIAAAEHASLGRRYRAYVEARVGALYFRDGAAESPHPIGRRELPEALKQAYVIRSQYVHRLRQLPDALTVPHGHWESTSVDGRPVLTFQGLSRLTRRVIRAFVEDGPKTEHEPYNYTLEQSGVISMQLAAQYWIWQPLRHAREGRRRLEGLLEQLVPVMARDKDAKLTDLRPMLADVERIMPRAARATRPALYALYVLFNGIVHPDGRSSRFKEFLERYSDLGEAAAGEIILVRTIFGTTSSWPLKKLEQAYQAYWNERWIPSGFHAPRPFESAMTLTLAERCRADGNTAEARKLLDAAVDEHPGHSHLLQFVSTFDPSQSINWRQIIFPDAKLAS